MNKQLQQSKYQARRSSREAYSLLGELWQEFNLARSVIDFVRRRVVSFMEMAGLMSRWLCCRRTGNAEWYNFSKPSASKPARNTHCMKVPFFISRRKTWHTDTPYEWRNLDTRWDTPYSGPVLGQCKLSVSLAAPHLTLLTMMYESETRSNEMAPSQLRITLNKTVQHIRRNSSSPTIHRAFSPLYFRLAMMGSESWDCGFEG